MRNRLMVLCGAGAVAMAAGAWAEDFPLTFRSIPAKDVVAFPGGSGSYGSLRAARPASLNKEPRAASQHPLYGECRDMPNSPGLPFRLDESRGDGTGYDQLVVDVNENGDLSDDPVVRRAALPAARGAGSSSEMLFGPIEAPATKAIAGKRPSYYAQVYLYNRQVPSSSAALRSNITSGRLILKAGWYLDATVDLGGVRQLVGVFDGNSNQRLGDATPMVTYSNRTETGWYFRSGDSLLVDVNRDGRFESDRFQSEAHPFGPVLYLGSKPYRVTLAPDCKALRVEPWTEALAEVTLQPRGSQVRSLTLAWESSTGRWQLLRPEVTGGKVLVPPGDYRLYACSLVGKGASRDQVMASGMLRIQREPVSLAAGKANTLNCGAPLEVKVTVTKARASSRMLTTGDSRSTKREAESVLRINANVAGAGGEVYSSYYRGERFNSQPGKPTFTIAEAGGRTIANGNLEFG